MKSEYGKARQNEKENMSKDTKKLKIDGIEKEKQERNGEVI